MPWARRRSESLDTASAASAAGRAGGRATAAEAGGGQSAATEVESGRTAAPGGDMVAEVISPEPAGLRHEVADRIERWLVPVVRWVRRTLWLPIGSALLAAGLGVAAAIVWLGADGDGLATAAVVIVLVALPAVGVALFVRLLGELERLPATVRAAPENLGDLKESALAAGSELGELRQAGLLGLPGVLRWLRSTLGRLDAVGVAGVTAAVAALHPLRLAWIVVLCWLCVVAVPVAALALFVALQS